MTAAPPINAPDPRWSFPDHYRLVPPGILKARAGRAAALCQNQALDGLLLTGATDVYYLSGSMQQGAVLLDAQGEARLFARRHAGRAAAESSLPCVPVRGFGQVTRAVHQHLGPAARLGLCLDVMSAREYLGWQKRMPDMELVDASSAWQALKGVKDALEIEALTRCGRIATQVYEEMAGWLRPGLTEAEAAGRALARAVALGAMDLVISRLPYMPNYTWHLVSGPEGALPSAIDAPFGGLGPSPAFPQGAGPKPLKPHEPIIADLGICFEGYNTDQTRTYCLGSPPAVVERAHACLEEVDQALAEHLLPGAVSGDFYELAITVAARHGMEDVFLGRPDQRIKFVGHGVGLELGAPPYLLKGSQARIQAGETYALELKIVLKEGPVGLENSYLVNHKGPPALLTPIANRLLIVDI